MESFDDVCNKLSKLVDSADIETKKFVKKQAKILKKKTLEVAKKRVKKKTGYYYKSIKDGKSYEFKGSFACRVYSGAPHAHLIEEGHRIVKGKNGTELGRVKGKFVFRDTANEFKEEFEENSQKMLEELFEKNGFWGIKWLVQKIF